MGVCLTVFIFLFFLLFFLHRELEDGEGVGYLVSADQEGVAAGGDVGRDDRGRLGRGVFVVRVDVSLSKINSNAGRKFGGQATQGFCALCERHEHILAACIQEVFIHAYTTDGLDRALL